MWAAGLKCIPCSPGYFSEMRGIFPGLLNLGMTHVSETRMVHCEAWKGMPLIKGIALHTGRNQMGFNARDNCYPEKYSAIF